MLQKAARKVLGNAAAAVDLAIHRTALTRSGGQRHAEAFRHEERLAILGRFADRYEQTNAAQYFFREPRRIDVRFDVRFESPDGLVVTDVHWASDYEPFLHELTHEYGSALENRTATARLVTHEDTPRPVAILIHGYLGGVHRMERRIWPIEYFGRIGMDVALFVLPFHGPRGTRRALGEMPPFPGADPRVTNEGFRQAMGDLRDLVQWLRERGHPHVGVMGMSLGGFSTALAATIEPELAFAVPIIPLGSFPDLIRWQGRLGSDPRKIEAQYKALEAVYRVTSPLHRPAAIASERILVIGGERDQITPVAHARKLAEHFRCRIETWPGGHLIQFGRGEKFRNIGRFLNDIGVLTRLPGNDS